MIRGGIRRLAAVRRHRFRLKSVPPVSITAEEATPLLWENTENGYTFLCGSLDTACGWCPPPGRLVWGAGTPSSAPHPSLSCSGPRLPSFTRPNKHVRRGSASVSCCPIFSRLEISRSFQSPFRRSLDVLLRPVGPWQTDRKTRPRPFDHVSIGLALPPLPSRSFRRPASGRPGREQGPFFPLLPKYEGGRLGSPRFDPFSTLEKRPVETDGFGGRWTGKRSAVNCSSPHGWIPRHRERWRKPGSAGRSTNRHSRQANDRRIKVEGERSKGTEPSTRGHERCLPTTWENTEGSSRSLSHVQLNIALQPSALRSDAENQPFPRRRRLPIGPVPLARLRSFQVDRTASARLVAKLHGRSMHVQLSDETGRMTEASPLSEAR